MGILVIAYKVPFFINSEYTTIVITRPKLQKHGILLLKLNFGLKKFFRPDRLNIACTHPMTSSSLQTALETSRENILQMLCFRTEFCFTIEMCWFSAEML